MILTDQAIIDAIRTARLRIAPFALEHVKGASYTFTLGSMIRVPKKMKLVTAEQKLEFDDHEITADGFILQPNSFVLGYTQEMLSLQNAYGCFLSTRGSCAQMGLNVLLSSTFAEPDTDSILALEIHNASPNPILLQPGLKIVKGIFLPVS